MGKLTIEKAAFYTGIVNGSRKEIITSDSAGGFRVWALRFTPSSGYKGFLRVHAGNRKSHYRYLFLTRNEEVILACTPSRIQAFDATTCARITTLYKSTTGSIAHVSWDDASDALHLSLSNQPRQVLKYSLASNRGRQLVLNSEAKACANEDIAVFTTANVDQSALKAETVNFDGIFFVDDCGNFTVSANRSLEVDGDSNNQQAPTISLQLSPSTENYLELHTLSSAQYRTFVLAVCSSGIYVIETFLPGSITRRVITNVPGTSLKAIQHGEWRRIAVHCAEPPSLLLLDSDEDQFCAMVLQPPSVTDSSSTSGQPKLPSLVDYAAFSDGIVMAWSNGLVSRYCLTTGRTQAMFCLKNPTTLVVLSISVGSQLIVVGDEEGWIAVWSVAVDREQKEISTHEVCSGRYVPQALMVSCIKNLRNVLSSVAAILNVCMAKTVEAAISLVSLSSGGDVKMWSMQFGQAAVQWTLLACFHTYASSLSASALLSPGYVFCGSEEGGFECWKIPDASAIMATNMLHPSHRAVVIKRPVHSLDVHLARICHIVVEPGDAGKRMTEAPAYLDEFTWIVTYDSDAIALIWCMSPSFLYPYRRIKLHGNPLGSFLTLHDSALRFFAYLGRCLECVDILTEGDKNSSKDRLRRGREKSSEVQHQDHVRYDISGQRQSDNIDVAQTSGYSSGESCSPALRIRITVPTIDYVYFAPDSEHVMLKQPPTPISSKITKYIDRESPGSVPQRAKCPSKQQQGDADGIIGTHLSREDSCSKQPLDYELPDLTAPEDLSLQRYQAAAPRRIQNPRVRPQTTFVPETLPSQFRLAKPRIYRTDSRPQTSLQQMNCSVVTTSIGFSGRQGHNPSENAETDDSTLVLIGEGKGSKGQDKLAIVGVVDGTHTELRLDFQGTGRPGGVAYSLSSRSSGGEKLFGSSSIPLFVPWNALSNEQQLAELTAASRSRCIQGDSDEDAIDVPSVTDFSNPDIKVQLKVRSFSRWYLSRYQSRQYHREAFLWEELACAVSDILVQTEVSQAGLRIPSPEDRDSSVWRDFSRWYAFGKTQLVSTSGKPQPERLESRSTFLKRRLRMLTEAEERHRRNNSAVDLMKTQLFVFDDLSVSPSIDSASISAWEPLDIALKQSEIALALRDPDIQIAAISSQIDLPDMDAVLLPGCDVLALSNAFVSWWATDGNKHRRNFLSLEAEEAGQDGTVHEILEQEAHNTGEDDREGKSFVDSYFGSTKARLDFLERKLVRLRQEHRIGDVFMYAKLPAPVLFEALVIPLLVVFSFPEPVIVRSDDVPPFTGTDDCDVDAQADSSSADMGGREHTTEDTVVDESDVERNAIELELMTIEDALSRELGNAGVDSESEDEHEEVERHIEPPKRTDFTRSYFFGNLPSSVRLTSDGWAAGSGVDNGDEEIEEEERLERERKHQEMLDQQEAERLAELERLAEQARLEKEKEEKALQLRRLRLAELKEVLAHQAELEAARIEQLERESMEANLLLMAHEDFDERSRMRNLEQERVAMVLEDEQSRKVERAIRDAHVQAMRKLLAELTAMTAEDKRSAIVQKEQQLLEEAKARRRQYLQALYTPTDPFFAASKSPSEEMLPALHDRCLDRLRKVKGQQEPRYALSFAETVVLDEVDHEVYVARDSRKLRVLMGLSTASSANRKTMRIPSERDIIQQRHQQQLQILEADEDQGPETRVERAMTVQRKKRPNQENSRAATKLPDLLQWKTANHTRLTDLSTMAHQNQPTTKSTDKKARGNNNPPSSTVLPFFRGNFGVRGEGKTRAKDYIE